MAKVHPQSQTPAAAAAPLPLPLLPDSNCMISSRRETFTLWMKSLVMHGNGYTVYNSDGDIVYRIDNYNNKSSSEVYLMDLQGKVLFTILRRKLRVFGRWEGYKCINGSKMEEKKIKPCFQVRKHWRILGSSCEVTVRPNDELAQSSADHSCHCRLIEGYAGKSTMIRIVDSEGGVMAEVKQKQTSSGVVLGDDVLNLVVEPHVDHSLVMALVAVSGLIHHRI